MSNYSDPPSSINPRPTYADLFRDSLGNPLSALQMTELRNSLPLIVPMPSETNPQSVSSDPSASIEWPADYGKNNKLVSRERAEELRKLLKAKFNQLN